MRSNSKEISILFCFLLSAGFVVSQANFNCPDTLFVTLSNETNCSFTVPDYADLADLEAGATLSQTPNAGTLLDIEDASYFDIQLEAENGVDAVSCEFILQVIPPEPAPIPNEWLVKCYNGKKIFDDHVYRGYYRHPDLNIVSWWLWDTGLSPSYYSEYVGCDVNVNQHTVSYERTGFPCGNYALDILNHDNEVQLFVDDELVFENTGFNLQHYDAYIGELDASSKVRFEWNEGIGGSLGILDFRLLCPTDTIVSLGAGCEAAMPDYRHAACEDGSVTQSIAPGTILPEGIYPLTIITTDINGQQDSCTTNIHFIDDSPQN